MRLSLVLIVILGSLVAVPVYAYEPPGQSSDNASDVIIWHGDNLTIESANVTIDSLEDALVAAAEAQAEAINENNSDIATEYLTLVIVALLIALVFWQKSIVLYAVGTPVAIVYGLSLAQPGVEPSLWLSGVAIAIIGTYFLYRDIMIAFNWGKKKWVK